MSKGEFTKAEIASQPEVWRATLQDQLLRFDEIAAVLEGLPKKNIIVVGCGSTYFLSLSTAAFLRKKGYSAWGLPSFDLVQYPEALPPHDYLLLTISRSGTTSETLWAVEHFRDKSQDSTVITITVRPQSPLAQKSDVLLAAPAADEISVTQTRSFTSMLLCAQLFCEMLAKDSLAASTLLSLPDTLVELLNRAQTLPQQLGRDRTLKRLFFLGAGPLYGLACEAMLKTKEMSSSWAEAYHPLELRHGPMSVVNAESLVIGFISDRYQANELRVLLDMKQLGAKTMAIVENSSDQDWSGIDFPLELRSGLTEWERAPLYLPIIQWLGYYRSLDLGFDPDKPANLTQVIELDGPKPL